MQKATAAIIGPGNVGTDLMYKLLSRTENLVPRFMIGVNPDSTGLKRAAAEGLSTSADGVDWLFAQDELPDIVFEATSAHSHLRNAARYQEAGITAIDLTPAGVGQFCVPAVNMDASIDCRNVNMVTCGGQATVPIVAAVSAVVPVDYAEGVSTLASQSAGPGTRQNIDEFTKTSAASLVSLGGAQKGKAIIILNPADPPLMTRSTIYCSIPPAVMDDKVVMDKISESIHQMVSSMRATYAPGYRLRADPQFDGPKDIWKGMARVAVFIEVIGCGDFLPAYAGNIDLISAAAAEAGNAIAERRIIPNKEAS